MMSNWHAQWIWLDQPDRQPRNQTIIARKAFQLPAYTSATLKITTDSQYRLFINGQWVEDGPCRSWPRHYQYDVIDVTTLLRPGRNVIAVVARHYGVSNFHQVPLEAGVLAQLEVTTATGDMLMIATDETWKARESAAAVKDTVRISIQMEPSEWYDATQEFVGATGEDFDDSDWPAARAYYAAEDGPWQDLHPRDVRFLTREPVFPQCVTEANVVTSVVNSVSFDLKRLAYPDDHTSNWMAIAGILSSIFTSEKAQTIPFVQHMPWGVMVLCNGQPIENDLLPLRVGDNLISLRQLNGGTHIYSYTLGFRTWDGISQRNPMNAADANPWAWIGPINPKPTPLSSQPGSDNVNSAETNAIVERLAIAKDAQALRASGMQYYSPTPAEVMIQVDGYHQFMARQVVGSANALLDNSGALLADNREWTTVRPSADGDVELCLDLGKEVVGWSEFELIAPAGTVVDIDLIEYRDGDALQHTGDNHNGMRYITREGLNHFVSMKRRAGRYLFLTLRQMTAPVQIRMVRVLLATYPVEHRGAFRCSDASLNRIWEISTYTLRLCMEDTLTDCPLYEQTLWVGDARNESLYNYICYGAYDLSLRCLRLSAQSLDVLPLIGCQVPSGWDVILPAWSSLWGINVWEHYFVTGDKAALAELYPAVIENLRATQRYCTDRGLFSIAGWNLFDWAGIDYEHKTVIYNSQFAIGAIDAAIKCCDALDEQDGAWLRQFRQELQDAVLALWDNEKGSYPDSIHDDGSISPATCQHTSALALLYDVLPEGCQQAAVRNIVNPPEGMVRVGSPFALQYFMEALEKIGDAAHAVQLVRTLWQDMLDCGATTCWETFRDAFGPGFPTRCHCHAWSSAPIYVFNRLLLGIIPTAVGATEVVVSPHPLGLMWADGTSASPRGDLQVAWRIENGTLSLTVKMPEGVAWRVEPNADWQGINRVVVNGEEVALAVAV